MVTLMVVSVVCFIFAAIGVAVLVWLAVDFIREKRKKKHIKKMQGDWKPGELQERAEWRRHAMKRMAEQQAWQERVYEMRLCFEKEFENQIQRAQARTQTESPEEFGGDAVFLYECFIEWYSEGYKIFMGKPSHTGRMCMTRFRFDPLDRVRKKIVS